MELDASRSRFILQSCLLYFGMAQNQSSSNLIMALGLEPPSGKLLLAAKRKAAALNGSRPAPVQFEAVIKPPPSVEPVGRTESFKKHLLCHLPKDQVEHTNQHDAHDGGVN
ncbi:unnamed protein product [Durusdinium trenchii]|uniref:Uncharacterized protein n=1 Tax=Durusdinium trenchii TaxID=1381693 RepID=A0ABP0P8L5_9DINO